MPLKMKFDRDSVDDWINSHLAQLYSLPKEDAIAALAELSRLSMMEKFDEKNPPPYPKLPALFQKKVYQAKEIQEALTFLSEVMYNRQPQDPVHSQPKHRPVNWGKFNLIDKESKNNEVTSRGGQEKITADDVRHYMKYKFAATACNVLAFHEAKAVIAEMEEKEDSALYQSNLAAWMASGADDMPDELQELLLSEKRIRELLQESLKPEESSFREFLLFLDQSAIGFVSEEKQHIELRDRPFLLDAKQIAANFFALSPALFDKEMADNIEAVLTGQILRGKGILKLEILKTPSCKLIQQKIKKQIESGEHFSKGVLSSFTKVVEVNEMLNRYADAIKIHAPDLVVDAQKICQDYVNFLNNTPEDKWLPLEQAKMDKLEEVLQSSKDFSDDFAFIDWTRDFFSIFFEVPAVRLVFRYSYYGSDGYEITNEQAKHLQKMFYYVLDQNRVFISDEWIHEVHEETQKNHPEEKGVALLKPQHRNRVFLHALNLPVQKWTPIFYETFNEILTLLETSRDPDVRREKQSSYPDEFMAQLRWLRDHYVDVTTQSQNPRYKPRESRFPLLYYTHFQTILTLVSEKSITGVFQNMRETEPNHLDWAQFFYYLHPEQMAAIFSNGENWSECFKSAVQVITIMEKLQFNPQILNQFCAGIVNQWPIIISSKYFDRSNAIKILSLLPDDQKRVFCESMKNRWGDFIYDHETHMEISGLLNPELMKYVMECVESYRPAPVAVEAKDEDSSLLRILRVYIEDRKKQPPTSRMNLFVWSDQDKIEAANALMKSFNNLIPLDKKYIKPLCDGKLKNQLEIHLAKYRPGVTLEQFLEERTKIKPVPPAPRLRRNSPDSK